MRVIHDDECGGIMMIPLLHGWGVRRCNVDGCTNKPTTIVSDPDAGWGPAGICEPHYQSAKEAGDWKYHLVEVPMME